MENLNNSYKLFLDDDAGKPEMESFRNPPIGEENWWIAHSTKEAINLIETVGIPSFIDFDHDLGEDDSAMKFLNWLANNYPESIDQIDYKVHSLNQCGKQNIISFMESWKKSRL